MLFLLLFMLAFSLLLVFVLSSAFVGFVRTRVPFVPTSTQDVYEIVEAVHISKSDVFYDLGSGDGKVVFLVEKLSGARVKGFELTLWTHVLAKLKKLFKGSRAEFVHKNFFSQDWSEATIIYCYLYPPLMGRVEQKFRENCKPGTLAVVRDFPFPGMAPETKYVFGPERDASRVPLTQEQLRSKLFRLGLLFKSIWSAARPMSHTIYVYKL